MVRHGSTQKSSLTVGCAYCKRLPPTTGTRASSGVAKLATLPERKMRFAPLLFALRGLIEFWCLPTKIMMDAHVKSMTLLATPFKAHTVQPFAFGPTSQWSQITAEIREQIPIMLQHRLTPPPRETYSLNRKLSGAFLLAARLNAKVHCKRLWDEVVDGYQSGQ